VDSISSRPDASMEKRNDNKKDIQRNIILSLLWERCTIPIICEKSRLGTVEVLNDLLMSVDGVVVETPPPFLD